MPAIHRANISRVFCMEAFLGRNTESRCRPHVRDINILIAITVEVQPTRTHARAHVLNSCLSRNGRKCAVTVIPIQIASAEVIGNIQIRPAIGVVVSPRAREAVAIIVNVQAGGFCPIFKTPTSLIVKQEVWRAIASVEIRRRIPVLIQSGIVVVQTEIDIETAVMIVVCDRGMGECTLRWPYELEGIVFGYEFSLALIYKKQGAATRHHQQVLFALVIEICEQRARCRIKNVESGRRGYIVKSSVSSIAVKPVRKA